LSSPATFASRLSRLVLSGRRWVVLAMLLALHAALVAEPDSTFQRLWLLVHFGFFLLWQPFFAAEREVEVVPLVLFLAVLVVLLWFAAGWMIVMWMVLLLGILGGRVFTMQAAQGNRFYLVAFAYTLAMLLLWAVPAFVLGEHEVPDAIAMFCRRFLPFALVLLVLLPFPRNEERAQVFDFFYAVLVFQLGIVLVLGSVVMMRYTDEDYVESVGATVMVFAALLFVFAVLWNPVRGYGGLRTYLSAYLMSVGMPFELWMRSVAELAESEADPRRFLEESLRQIGNFPWMRGGEWHAPDGEGKFGSVAAHATRFTYRDLEIVFYTEIRLSPALFLHMRLLAQVVGEFYEGKRRETTLRRNAYLQAVHETGARLTHDVKNLLQSLYALMSMAPRDAPGDGYGGLLQRQLPQLTHRLQAALEKLRSPEIPTQELSTKVSQWWADVERRLSGSDIACVARISLDADLPSNLFDTFIENALENARAKREREPGIAISLELESDENGVRLRVRDTGSAVPPALVARLFQEPLERSQGLGIGLYHVARQALIVGYRLTLAENRDGRVSFALQPEESSSGAG
jgi:signal transduction histidine kinase